jgi:hypothetical protein
MFPVPSPTPASGYDERAPRVKERLATLHAGAVWIMKNVHHRLLASAAAWYREWSARQPAAPVRLSLTVDGRPVALDAAGAFVAPGAAGGRLVVTTSAGDATAVVVTASAPLG